MSDELIIDFDAWQQREKPAGISACIRVRNESQFMGAAVRSIVELVDEVVLLVQPSDDNTLEIAHELAEVYSKVNVYYYPLVPDWIDTEGFYKKNPNEPGHIVHMSNYALSKCNYSWILKIEGDVIALPTLKNIIQNVRDNIDKPVYYGLVILNVAGRDMNKISWENPRNGGWDEALFPNNPARARFIRRSKWEVVDHDLPNQCMGWALLHMKRCKVGKDESWDNEHYVDWTPDVVDEALRNYNKVYEYPAKDDPFGRHVLYTTDWKRYL
jgi:hypothetical protein